MADPNEVGGNGWIVDPTNPNRATYTDESGQTYEITRPQAAAPSQTSEPKQPRGAWERFTDAINQSAQEGFGGQVAQAWYDMTDAMKPELKQKFPGRSDDWYEQMSDRIISESRKAVIDEYAAKQAADPNWKPDESFMSAVATPSKWVPWLAGQLVGGAGPESLINPGGSATTRVLSQVGVGGLTDVGYQGLNMAEDVRDEYDPWQTLGAAAAGGGLQTVFEIPGFVRNLFKGRGIDTTPGADPRGAGVTSFSDADMNAALAHKQSLQLDAVRDKDGNIQYWNVTDPANGQTFQAKSAAEINDYVGIPRAEAEAPDLGVAAPQDNVELSTPEPAPAPKISRGEKARQKIEDTRVHIAELTRDWENGPEFDVINSTKDLPKDLKNLMPDDAIAAYTPDGRVIINLKNAKTPEAVSAAVFHEGLGHHGLAQKFNDDLDRVLEDLYDNSKGGFRQEVDDWRANNPNAYGGNLARAAEEVLAEMSEAGKITPSMFAKLRNHIKQFGRNMGLDLKYSDSEIKTILGMAHAATVKGTPSVGANGFRLKATTETPTYRESEGKAIMEYAQARQMRPSEVYKQYVNGDETFRGQFDARIKELEAIERAREASADARATRYKTDPEARREKIKAATAELNTVEPGKTKTVQPFPEEEPDYWRFQHRTEDGKVVSGTYTVEGGKIDNFSISSEGGPRSAGVRTVRQIGRDLLKEHPEAKSLGAYRMTGARAKPEFMDTGVRFSKKAAEEGEEKVRVGALNPDKIKTVADIDEHLYELEAVNPKSSSKTWAETEAEAQSRGLTPSRIAKRRGADGLSSYLRAANQALTDQLEKVASLETKLNTEGYSVKRHEELLKAMATLKAVHARVNYDNSEVGRALNILRMATESKDKAKLLENIDLNLLSDPDQFMKFMAQFNQAMKTNPNGAIRMLSNAFDPKAEDYIFAAWYNMMLSSPSTHAANFAGTGMNFMYDLLENTGAAVTGQFKRFSNADRVRAREVMYRMYGALAALKTASTWTNTRESLNTGMTGNQVNTKGGGRSHNNVLHGNKALDAASGVLEAPSRLLAGADEWWRNVIQLSNIYGLAVRNAGNKGLKGKAFWTEVNDLIAKPTKEMIDSTNDYTKVIQFLDKPSAIGTALIDLQTPKQDSTIPGRVARGVLRAAIPFVRTPDSLIRTTIRRMGPLGAFERENIKGWKAGGAERDKVKARLIMGSALSFYVAAQAYKGDITGEGPTDYKKRAEWEGSHQKNSVKVNGKYVSIEGLEPVSTNILAIATLVERYKAGEISKESYLQSAASLAQGMGAVLSNNSYMEGLNNLLEVQSGSPDKAENALENFMANLASSATTPAIVRKYNQSYRDTTERDTTGEGSPEDRIAGRIMSGFPGLSEQLPAKYDVYGREQTREGYAGPDFASRMETRMEESDPVVQELARLAETTPKVIIGRPSKNGIKVNGETRTLNAEEFQDYQHLSGYWIVEAMRQQMQTPEWKSMSDAEKIDLVQEIRDEVRKAAREALFDPEDEQPDNLNEEEE